MVEVFNQIAEKNVPKQRGHTATSANILFSAGATKNIFPLKNVIIAQ